MQLVCIFVLTNGLWCPLSDHYINLPRPPLDSRSTSIARSSPGTCRSLGLNLWTIPHTLQCSESCIKGHRSSSCHHTDRPLFEIKKKGRPVSQCEKCRELRQSKKVHSKCTCNPKSDPASRGEVLASTTSKCMQPPTQTHSHLINQSHSSQIHTNYSRFAEWTARCFSCVASSNFAPPRRSTTRYFRCLYPLYLIRPLISRVVDSLLNPCNCKSVWKCKCRQPQSFSSADESTSESTGDLATLAHVAAMRCCDTS